MDVSKQKKKQEKTFTEKDLKKILGGTTSKDIPKCSSGDSTKGDVVSGRTGAQQTVASDNLT